MDNHPPQQPNADRQRNDHKPEKSVQASTVQQVAQNIGSLVAEASEASNADRPKRKRQRRRRRNNETTQQLTAQPVEKHVPLQDNDETIIRLR